MEDVCAMIALRGETTVLRTLERAHCRALWEAYEPTEPLPTEPLNPGLSVEKAEQWFEEMQAKQGKQHVYLGIFTDEGALLGDIQLANLDWRHRTATLGVGIARRADRGQGYGSDAARTLLAYGFRHLDLHRVSAATASYNVAMQRVLERCGFVQEGREREAIYCDGQRWDRLRYGLLRVAFRE
jgi:RimJ/RimL family protein N-acetyltransferase